MCNFVGIYQTQPMFDKAEKLARKVSVNRAKKALQTQTLTALNGLHILLILHILHILYYLHSQSFSDVPES